MELVYGVHGGALPSKPVGIFGLFTLAKDVDYLDPSTKREAQFVPQVIPEPVVWRDKDDVITCISNDVEHRTRYRIVSKDSWSLVRQVRSDSQAVGAKIHGFSPKSTLDVHLAARARLPGTRGWTPAEGEVRAACDGRNRWVRHAADAG